jgi:hypothetical protein
MIFRVGERTVRSCRDWDEAMAGVPTGPVALTVKRGDAMVRLTLTVERKQ